MLKNRIEKQLGGTLRTLAFIGAAIFAFSGCSDKKNDPAKENEGPQSVVDYTDLLFINARPIGYGTITIGFPETEDDFVTLRPGMGGADCFADSIILDQQRDSLGNIIPIRMNQLKPIEVKTFLKLDSGVIKSIKFRTIDRAGKPTGYRYTYNLMENASILIDFGFDISFQDGHLTLESDSIILLGQIEKSLARLTTNKSVEPVGTRNHKSIFEY